MNQGTKGRVRRQRTDQKSKEEPTARIMTKKEMELNPREVAQSAVRPSIQAASTIRAWKPLGAANDVELPSLVLELLSQSQAVVSGKMGRPESILIDQAHTLDAIFNRLARAAAANFDAVGEDARYREAVETYLRLAFRAQSQCRATLETLGALKNPSAVAFVRQANIANGPQQVNNGVPAPGPAIPSRARESVSAQSRLLERQHGERLDTLAAGAAGGADPAMAPLGEIHGTENDRRQSAGEPQRLQRGNTPGVARTCPSLAAGGGNA